MQAIQSSDETLSLYRIVRKHCRERLLVEPLRWTNRQLELLQCSFDESFASAPVLEYNIVCASDGIKQSEALLLLHAQLCRPRKLYAAINRVSRRPPGFHVRLAQVLLFLRAIPADEANRICHRIDLSLYLGGRCAKTLPCSVFFPRYDNGQFAERMFPIAAHVEQIHVNYMREAILRPSVRKHSPPYQRKTMGRLAGNKDSMVVFPSKVLFTSDDNTSLHLYSADIPCALLDMFDQPSVPPPTQPSVLVHITAIPYKPLDTLRSRLLALLVPESYSQVDRKRKFESDDTQSSYLRRKMDSSVACT